MFAQDVTVTTTATPQALWARYQDVATWAAWDSDLRSAELHGPFAPGTEGRLVPREGPPLAFQLTEVTPQRRFADEARLGPTTVRFIHTLQPLTGGTLITHRVEVEGPSAAELGPRLAAGLGASTAALGRLAAVGRVPALGGLILYTVQPRAKAAFYARAFGLEVASEGPEGAYVQLCGAVPLAFASEDFIGRQLSVAVRPSRASQSPGAFEVLLVCDDVPASFRRAVEAGATAVQEPEVKPWGQHVAYVRDDDGVLVELCSPWG